MRTHREEMALTEHSPRIRPQQRKPQQDTVDFAGHASGCVITSRPTAAVPRGHSALCATGAVKRASAGITASPCRIDHDASSHYTARKLPLGPETRTGPATGPECVHVQYTHSVHCVQYGLFGHAGCRGVRETRYTGVQARLSVNGGRATATLAPWAWGHRCSWKELLGRGLGTAMRHSVAERLHRWAGCKRVVVLVEYDQCM